MKVDIKQLRELIETLCEFDLDELEIKHGDERIRLGRGRAVTAVSQAASASEGQASTTDDGTFITSPFVGTFYRSPTPEADVFVKVGDQISAGTPLCIVEAMKLMNEIESEVEGTIVEVLAENGKPVEYGDQLFKIKPS